MLHIKKKISVYITLNSAWHLLHVKLLHKLVNAALCAAGFDLRSKRAINKNAATVGREAHFISNARKNGKRTHFDTEVASVNVVPQEQVARGRWRPAHFE